jgi:carbon-monoxide dehydrogenase medium subunit
VTLNCTAIAASRKRIAPFRLHRPDTIAAACAIVQEHGSAAGLCAGGIDLINRMKAGESAAHVVALEAITEMHGVRDEGDAIFIGAMTRHWQIESDPVVRARLPSLAAFVAGLGNLRVRMQGTIGGNIMAGEAAYEMLPALAALDADLLFADPASGAELSRPAIAWLSAREPWTPRLLTGVRIPLRGRVLAWNRDLRAALGLECVAGLALRADKSTNGLAVLIGDKRGALAAEIRGDDPQQAAHDWAQRLPDIIAASGAGAAYCRRVASVMLRRALTEARAQRQARQGGARA